MNVDSAEAERIWWVDQRHASATDEGPGSTDRPFRTISRAAFVAEPGDTVRVRAGVYRERVAPRRGGESGRPITYEAAPGQRVVIKASEVWAPEWRPVEGHPALRRAALDDEWFEIDQAQAADWGESFPRRFNPFEQSLRDAAQVRSEAVDPYGDAQGEGQGASVSLGQLFIDGVPMPQVSSLIEASKRPGVWVADDDGRSLVVHLPEGYDKHGPPRFEVTVRPRCFAPYKRGLGHIVVRGFVMEHGATQYHRGFYGGHGPQAGILSTRGGHHWVIERNTVRFGKTLGMDIGTEGGTDADGLGQPEPQWSGDHVIRFNTISDNGAGGIQGHRSPRSVIAHNVIERNNQLGFGSPEIGAIKLHYFIDGRIENNLIRNNDAFGVWLDNVFHRAVVRRNVILDNAGAGVFMEMGHGPATIDHNVIAYTRFGPVSGMGDGLYAHDASRVTFAHNLVYFNAGHGLYAHHATERRPNICRDGVMTSERVVSGCSGWRIVGNVFAGNPLGSIALPPPSPTSSDNRIDHNAYAGTLPTLTSETWAAALGETGFRLLNNKGRLDLTEAMPGVSFDEDNSPALSLERWRALTGQDRHSRHVTLLRPKLDAQALLLSVSVGQQIESIHVPRIADVDIDLDGRPLGDKPLPGPLQRLVIDPRLADPPGDAIAGRGPFNRVNNDYRNIFWLTPHVVTATDEP